MNLRYLIYIILISSTFASYGQVSIETIQQSLANAQGDQQKYELLHELAEAVKEQNSDSATVDRATTILSDYFRDYLTRGEVDYALRIYYDLHLLHYDHPAYVDTLIADSELLTPYLDSAMDSEALSNYFLVKTRIHDHQNNTYAAYTSAMEAERYLRRAGDSTSVDYGYICAAIGDYASGANQYPQAIEYLALAEDIFRQHSDNQGELRVLSIKTNLYSILALYEKSAELRARVIDLCHKTGSTHGLIQAYYFGSRDYRDQEDYQKEKAYLMKALQLSQQSTPPDEMFLYLAAADLSSNYAITGQIDSSIHYLNLAKSLYTPQSTTGWRDVFYHKTMAYYNRAIGDWRAAVASCDKGIAICVEHQNTEAERRFGEFAAEILEEQGLFAKAYPYQKRSSTLRDQIVNAKNVQQMQFMQAEYESAKKDQEISTHKNTITLLHQKTQIRNLQLVGSIIGLPLIFALFYVYRSRRRANRANEQLEKTVAERTADLIKDKRIIEEQANQLRSLDQLKNRFYANISHELRTPLALVASPLSQIKKKTSGSPDVQRYVHLALDNTAVLQERVEELLDLSKLEQAELRLELSDIDLTAVLHRVAGNFDSLIRDKGLHLNINLDIGDSYLCQADLRKLQKIIQNLMHNAIKYTNSGGQISIGATASGDDVTITVTDSGRGISEEDLPHIFDRYFQSLNPAVEAEGGTGIGLALVRELSELMGGVVSVQSQQHIGSRFVIELPLPRIERLESATEGDATDTEETAVSVAMPYIGARPSLLIVEDNRELRDYLQESLREHYDTHTAANGAVALELIRQGTLRPQLILSDLMMPEMNGLDLLAHIRSMDELSKVPFCFLTAKAGMEDKIEALNIGVDDYILKPFVLDEVVARLDNLYARYQTRQLLDLTNTTDDVPAKATILQIQQLAYKGIGHTQFSVDYIAEELDVSRRHIYDVIKKETGLSPSKYIRELRLSYARRIWERQPETKVKDIALAVGFKKVSYFSSLYRQRFGRLPSD